MPKFDQYGDYDPREYRLARAEYNKYMEEQDDFDDVLDPDDDYQVQERFNERIHENCSWDAWYKRKFSF